MSSWSLNGVVVAQTRVASTRCIHWQAPVVRDAFVVTQAWVHMGQVRLYSNNGFLAILCPSVRLNLVQVNNIYKHA